MTGLIHFLAARRELDRLTGCQCGRAVVAGSRDGRCARCDERWLTEVSEYRRYGDEDGVEFELRDAEIARLRVLLRKHGVEIPDELAATR